MRVYPFQVARVKPVMESPLVLASRPPPPSRIIDGGRVYTVKGLLAVCRLCRGCQYLVDWAGMLLRRGLRLLQATFLIQLSFGNSTDSTRISLGRQVASQEGGEGGGTVTSRPLH